MKMTHIYPGEASGQNKSVKQCIFINFSPPCPFVSSSLHIYICMYMCMYMCVYIYVYVFVCVCVCVSPQWLCGNSCTWAHDVRFWDI